MSNITLYRNSAERNKLEKSSSLTEVAVVNGTIEPSRDVGSLMNMSIVFEYSQVPNFNYCYIDSFERYYFVTDISLIGNNMYSVSLHEDVLMSHKSAINNLTPLVARTSNSVYYNKYLQDNEQQLLHFTNTTWLEIDNNSGIDSTSSGLLANVMLVATKTN